MRWRWRALLVLAVLAAAAAVLSQTVFAGKSADARRNEALFRSLPVYPGAVRVSLTSFSPHFAHDSTAVVARRLRYTTLAVYRVPKGTAAREVARFYVTRLTRRGWAVTERSLLPRTKFAFDVAWFTHDDESVNVDTSNVPYGVRTYEIGVFQGHIR